MYKALYDYNGKEANTLKFSAGDKLGVVSILDKNWTFSYNGVGELGYAPLAYISKDLKSEPEEVLQSVDKAIQLIHSTAAGKYTQEQEKNLRRLAKFKKLSTDEFEKQGWSGSLPRRKAPPPPTRQSDKELPAPKTVNATQPGLGESSPEFPGKLRNDTNTTFVQTDAGELVGSNICPSCYRQLDAGDAQQSTAPEQRTSKECSPVTNDLSSRRPPRAVQPDIKSPSSSPERVGARRRSSCRDIDWSGVVAAAAEDIRTETKLSHNLSQKVVVSVVKHLVQVMPAEVNRHLNVLLVQVGSEASRVTSSILGKHDLERLKVIFSELGSCKDDSQQRSWPIYEDEPVILEYLEELQSILRDADPNVCKTYIEEEGFEPVDILITFYQMESRLTVRIELLHVFAALCELHRQAISFMLSSVLPVELARDITSDTSDLTKLINSAALLAMLFSSGEPLPVKHYDHLDAQFVGHLLNEIEEPPLVDLNLEVPDAFIKILLAFNLRFPMPSQNLLMDVLSSRPQARNFTERLMIFVNREDDPVRVFSHHPPAAAHSVLKFLEDMFSQAATANLFYTNDVMVLIDIICRLVTDLSPGEKLRTEYLSLLYQLIKNSPYEEHRHRQDELSIALHAIADDDSDGNVHADRYIANSIITEFSALFAAKCYHV